MTLNPLPGLHSASVLALAHSIPQQDQFKNDVFSDITRAFEKRSNVAETFHGVRRIRQGAKGRRTATFPSRKAGGGIPTESRLELAHALALEQSEKVQDFRSQALSLPLGGGEYAFPDFLVMTTSGGYEIHEVKPSRLHLTHRQRSRFAFMEELLNGIGVDFVLIDEENLLTGSDLQETFVRYSRGHARVHSNAEIATAHALLCFGDIRTYMNASAALKANGLPVALTEYLHFHKLWEPVAGCCGTRGLQIGPDARDSTSTDSLGASNTNDATRIGSYPDCAIHGDGRTV